MSEGVSFSFVHRMLEAATVAIRGAKIASSSYAGAARNSLAL
jgi:hypothetical protein